MEDKKKILFINQSQFGYHIDYVQYCKYLKEDFDITYLCWDYNNKMIDEPGIKIIYLARADNKIVRNIRFILYSLQLIRKNDYKLIFIHYFRGSSLITFLNFKRQKLHLDIRTGGTSFNLISRNIYNLLVWFESLFFKSRSIISNELRIKLFLSKKSYILPLGGTQLSIDRRSKYKMHLLYVGCFTNRNLEKSIIGLNLFLKKFPDSDVHYTIIGNGWHNEINYLQNVVINLNLQFYVDLTGYIPYNELLSFYEKANVGVSYVPITPFFEFQPVTKTFEYLLAGMPVIATRTFENKKIINSDNGILISDTPESFADGIFQLYNRLDYFDEKIIRKTAENYEWRKIILSMKEQLINPIIEEREFVLHNYIHPNEESSYCN